MKIVLDTNVLVSGLLQPFGAPGEIVRMVSSGTLELCYDARILTEYREVLLRPRFPFKQMHVEALLDQITACGHAVSGKPLMKRLPDPDDEIFLEVAITGNAEYLVTGNLKHYPISKSLAVRVVPPSDFLSIYRRHKF